MFEYQVYEKFWRESTLIFGDTQISSKKTVLDKAEISIHASYTSTAVIQID